MNPLFQRLKELSKEDFEALIDQLLQARYPTARITLVEGTGGDEGIDNFQGILADGPAVWQHKHFPNRIQTPQRKQITKSIKAAFKTRTPRLWVLCVPIKLRTPEHNWFQQTVKAPYERRHEGTKVELMQASHIVHDLLHHKTIREAYFPDAVSDVSRLRQIATNTENLKFEDRAQLAAEYAQQYLSTLKRIDARFDYEVGVGTERRPSVNTEPGLILTFSSGELLTRAYARDIHAISQDPIRFKLTLDQGGQNKRRMAQDTGRPQVLTSEEIIALESPSALFNFIVAGTHPNQITLTPRVPDPDRQIPLRIVFGEGAYTREIKYLAFRTQYAGKRETTIKSLTTLPIDIFMVLRPEGESSFNIAPVLENADVRDLCRVIECLEALIKSPVLKIYSVESGALLLNGEVPAPQRFELNEGLIQVIKDAATVANRFGASLRLPAMIPEPDLEALVQLKRLATGEAFEVNTISATMIKDSRLQDSVFAGENTVLAPFRFEPQVDIEPIEIFGTRVPVGRPIFECARAELEHTAELRHRYLEAPDGASIEVLWRCLDKCRFYYGSAT